MSSIYAIEDVLIVDIDEASMPKNILLKSSQYGISDAISALKTILPMQSGDQYQMLYAKQDEKGMTHQRFQQYYEGIKVEFGNYIVHAQHGKITSMNGDFISTKALDIQAKLTSIQAIDIAKAMSGAKKFRYEDMDEERMLKVITADDNATYNPVAEKVIIQDFYGNAQIARLAYKVSIYSLQPFAANYYYVDAISGKLLYTHPIIMHANAETRYSGTRVIDTKLNGSLYELKDPTRGGGIETYNCKKGTNTNTTLTFTDADNNWTAAEFNNSTKDNAALDAHWGAEMTYDYWKNIHSRNSFDGNNTKIKSVVHYSSNYENAYWDGGIKTMVYGDGGSSFDALTSLDVCAHEIGHGVCATTANLTYASEPGALNEALSDIWAACVENYAAPEKAIWLIGEDIDKRSGHVALRSMSNPNQEAQPDTYKGLKWASTSSPSIFNDYGGVHTNSGVVNFWFYLLSNGGSGTNDKGYAYNVTGIGISKAQKIVFRAEDVYMTSSTKFADARTHTIQAAKDLYGAGSQEEISVTNAWYAVFVGAAYSGSSCGTVSNLTVNNITNTSAGLSFTGVSGATSYLIEYKTAAATSWTTLSNSTNTSANLSGLSTCTSYNVRVTTYCGTVPSVPATANFTSGGCTCPTPTNLAIQKLTATSFKLTWTAVSGAVSYNIRKRKTTLTNWTSVPSTTNTNKTVAAMGIGSTWEFQVQTVCANGSTSDWTASIYGYPTGLMPETSDPMSLQSFDLEPNINVYPNPARNILYLSNTGIDNTTVTVNLFEISGRNVYTKTINVNGTQQLNIATLQKGLYILQISNGDNGAMISTQKLVIE
jgi:Zn-dependent metalloprotease